jgi:hypothetical protein
MSSPKQLMADKAAPVIAPTCDCGHCGAAPVEQWLDERGITVRACVGASPLQPPMRIISITRIGHAIRVVGGQLAGFSRDERTGALLAMAPASLFEDDVRLGRAVYRPLHDPSDPGNTHYEPLGRIHSVVTIGLSDDGRLCDCGAAHTKTATLVRIEVFACVEMRTTPSTAEGKSQQPLAEEGEGIDKTNVMTNGEPGEQEQVAGKTHEGASAWITKSTALRWFPSMRIFSLQRCSKDGSEVSVCTGIMGMVMCAQGTNLHIGMTVAHVLVGEHDRDALLPQLVYRRLQHATDPTRALLQPFGFCMTFKKDASSDMAAIEFLDTIRAPNVVALPMNEANKEAIAAQMARATTKASSDAAPKPVKVEEVPHASASSAAAAPTSPQSSVLSASPKLSVLLQRLALQASPRTPSHVKKQPPKARPSQQWDSVLAPVAAEDDEGEARESLLTDHGKSKSKRA